MLVMAVVGLLLVCCWSVAGLLLVCCWSVVGLLIFCCWFVTGLFWSVVGSSRVCFAVLLDCQWSVLICCWFLAGLLLLSVLAVAG